MYQKVKGFDTICPCKYFAVMRGVALQNEKRKKERKIDEET